MAIRAAVLARIAGLVVAASVLSTGAATAASPVDDTTPPAGAVGGLQSPVRGTLSLLVDAVDQGTGLASASAILDGSVAATITLGTGCNAPDPLTGEPTPPNAGCVQRVTGAALPVDLSAAAVGSHHLQVEVRDAAGNATILWDGSIAVAGPDPVTRSRVDVTIGAPQTTTQSTSTPLASSTALPTASSCVRPELSFWLDEKALRVQRGKPVLRAGHRYRYRGRLTCLVGTRRLGAARGTPVDLLFRLRGRTYAVTGATTKKHGGLTVILAYPSTRTLIFRYRANGVASTVFLPIVVSRTGR